MTTDQVFNEDEVSINGVRFRLYGGSRPPIVQEFQAGVQPGKVAFGDFNLETHPLVSTWLAVNDQRGGVGIDRMDVSKDLDRCWISDCNLRHKGHLILPPLVTEHSSEPSITRFAGRAHFADLSSLLYGAFGGPSETQTVNLLSTTTWGSALVTFNTSSSGITDIQTGSINGTVTMVACNGTETRWTTDGSSWSGPDTTDISFVAFMNNLLWGVSSTGQLYSTLALASSWTTEGKLPIPSGYVKGLIVGKDADGEDVLYAATQIGLYVYDQANARWLKTALEVPFHPSAGRGCTWWRGAMYFSSGLAVYKFTPGTPATITVMGLDRDDGVDATYNGEICGLAGSHNELLATTAFDPASASTAYTSLWGWDERGWQKKKSNSDALVTYSEATAPFVSYAASAYRVYWGYAVTGTPNFKGTQHMPLEVGIVNPTQVTASTYAAGVHYHETPWFDAGGSHLNKTALRAHLDSTHPTSSETVSLEYATDWVESYTTMVNPKTATGDSHYSFGSGAGVEFRSIKFRVGLERGSTSTNTPDVTTVALEYVKTLEDLRGFTLQLDLRDQTGARPSQALVSAFNTIVNTRTLIDFGYRNETSRKVLYRTHSGLDVPGLSFGSVKLLTLVEVIP